MSKKQKAKDAAAKKQLQQAREIRKEDLAGPIKKPSPSYTKRKASQKKSTAARRAVPADLKPAVKAWGAKILGVQKNHSGYYAGRAAKALLDLGSNPKKHYQREDLTKDLIAEGPFAGGWYTIKEEGKKHHRKYREKEVIKIQRERNREKKINLIANKIGQEPAEVRALVKQIEREEKAYLRKYKKSAAYKKLSKKEKRKNTIKRRTSAIFAAMTDLLEIHGSPKALARDREDQVWKKVSGVWAVKEGKRWLQKVGPNKWKQVKARKNK